MKGSIKIVGTNETTKHLRNKLFEKSSLISESIVSILYLNEKKYILDIKETHFRKDHLLIAGMISDDESFVGNVAFEFYIQ
jgi:hypothetical protein